MGKINFGAPRADIQFLKTQHATRVFVETGTFQGETTRWAASIFDQVITIEGFKTHYESAARNLANLKNVECVFGDSRTALGQVLGKISHAPTLFWLDAHWMPGSFGDTAECPILEELNLIGEMSTAPIILIDDARLFLAPPPHPHRASDWPSLNEVIAVLSKKSRYTVIYDDVIFSVPEALKEATMKFFQDKTTEEYQAKIQLKRPSIARRVARQVLGK